MEGHRGQREVDSLMEKQHTGGNHMTFIKGIAEEGSAVMVQEWSEKREIPKGPLCWCVRAATAKYHRLGSLNNTK